MTSSVYTAQCVRTASLAGGQFENSVDFWPWKFYVSTVAPSSVSSAPSPFSPLHERSETNLTEMLRMVANYQDVTYAPLEVPESFHPMVQLPPDTDMESSYNSNRPYLDNTGSRSC